MNNYQILRKWRICIKVGKVGIVFGIKVMTGILQVETNHQKNIYWNLPIHHLLTKSKNPKLYIKMTRLAKTCTQSRCFKILKLHKYRKPIKLAHRKLGTENIISNIQIQVCMYSSKTKSPMSNNHPTTHKLYLK